VVDGVVRISLLGDCTIHADVIVTVPTASDPTHWPMSGTLTFTTADGKTILTSTGTGLCTAGTTKTNPSGVDGILDSCYDLKFVEGATGSFTIGGRTRFVHYLSLPSPLPMGRGLPGRAGGQTPGPWLVMRSGITVIWR
jgi:hypothetical protein